MLKFAANISLLWPELPYLDRFGAAADAGFQAVEVLFPYEFAAKETQRALTRSGLSLVLINAPPPNYTGGDRGFAAIPGLEERFRRDLKRAFRYTEALNVPLLHIMSGVAEGPLARKTLIDNLKWAAEAAPHCLSLTIEPLCPETMPGYFLNDYGLAVGVIEEVGSERIGLQFDSFHAQMLHGDAVAVYNSYAKIVGHVQIGDAPARGVPGSGTVDFQRLFWTIGESGYDGWISAEYTPGSRTEDGLGWRDLAQT
jgi:hydroxypyruvate isomerase